MKQDQNVEPIELVVGAFSYNSEPDVYVTIEGESPENGKPIIAKGYQGSGRIDKNSVYAECAKGPILGDADYYALQERDAQFYGPNVTEVEIRLDSPYVINGPSDIRRFANGKPIPWDNASRIQYFSKIRTRLEKAGYDGVIVNVVWSSGDVGLTGERSKQLIEVFGVTQIIKFRK